MKVGDRVSMSPMWKYEKALGTVVKIKKDYTIIKWDKINGEWHYTPEQAENLEVIEND